MVGLWGGVVGAGVCVCVFSGGCVGGCVPVNACVNKICQRDLNIDDYDAGLHPLYRNTHQQTSRG